MLLRFERDCISTAVKRGFGAASMRATTRSVFSAGVCLAMSSTCLGLSFLRGLLAQSFEGSKLQLLHRSWRLAKRFRDFADAFFFGEAHFDYAALLRGQLRQIPKELRTTLRALDLPFIEFDRRDIHHRPAGFACKTLPSVSDCVGGNAIKPGTERNAPPFEAREIFQRMLKDFRGDVLHIRASVDAPRDKRVDALEVGFVEVRETRAILLRRLDKLPLLDFVGLGLQPVLRRTRSL